MRNVRELCKLVEGISRTSVWATGIEEDEKELMWTRGMLGIGTPFSIIFTIWYYLTLFMGLRASDEHRKSTFRDLCLKTNTLGVEFLQLEERDSKTRSYVHTCDRQ